MGSSKLTPVELPARRLHGGVDKWRHCGGVIEIDVFPLHPLGTQNLLVTESREDEYQILSTQCGSGTGSGPI